MTEDKKERRNMMQRMLGKSKKGNTLATYQHNDPLTHKRSSSEQPVFVVMDGSDVIVQTLDWGVAFRTFQMNRG